VKKATDHTARHPSKGGLWAIEFADAIDAFLVENNALVRVAKGDDPADAADAFAALMDRFALTINALEYLAHERKSLLRLLERRLDP